ncbi:MAG: signal peptidase I [Lachnospiraceae bacterium]|nr:signal peptidase I [Lachnospiraceae bacterium]
MDNFEESVDTDEIKEITEPGQEETGGGDKPRTEVLKVILDYGLCIVIAVGIALILRSYVFVLGHVPSSSMYDTISEGDRVTIFRLAYAFSDPERGDIVSFYYPDDESEIFIKRIIGLPGEVIQGIDGDVYINGNKLTEPYTDGAYTADFGPYEIPDGMYFMMGDNRTNSLDSRYWKNKFVAKDKILGKSDFKIYPKFEKLEEAVYN